MTPPFFFFFDDAMLKQTWKTSSPASLLLVLVYPWDVGREAGLKRARGWGLVLLWRKNKGVDPEIFEDDELPCYTRVFLIHESG